MSTITVRLLDGFHDPAFLRLNWSSLLAQGDTDTVFLTLEWQRTWWDVFGRGKLLLLLAEAKDHAIACAPLFCDHGMVFFVGSGGSDYLDFIGDVAQPDVLRAILATARECAPGFVGFRFYHVPDTSRTGRLLEAVAPALALDIYDEGELPAPALHLTPAAYQQAIRKQSLRRHENHFRRTGHLNVRHSTSAASIQPHLSAFFAQHRARWATTGYPSLFTDPAWVSFYTRLTDAASATSWLRFTSLEWNGTPIAFHYGFCYRGSYLWYKPSFDIVLARRSPGEVLLRMLMIAAGQERAHTFDFGLGDEAFKTRFADHVCTVRTWGLYPMSS